MKLFGRAIINVKKRIHDIYVADGSEAAYAAYRAIMDTGVRESWRVVKPWIKKWTKESGGKG